MDTEIEFTFTTDEYFINIGGKCKDSKGRRWTSKIISLSYLDKLDRNGSSFNAILAAIEDSLFEME